MRARYDEVFSIAHGEMVELASARAPLARRALSLALQVPAAALARSLTALDGDLARGTLREAALSRLAHYGVPHRLDRAPAAPGPLLVVSNHPGLFDALGLFVAIGREDLTILAARRPLLTALPHLSRRLLSIDPGASGSVALKKALRHLRSGGALLHFPAGQIEPDPRVSPPGKPLLHEWKPGMGTLLTAAARTRPDLHAVAAAVSGVLSHRALRLAGLLGRGEKLATDAIVPLLQLTLPGFTDLDLRVRFAPPIPASEASAERLRAEVRGLCEASWPGQSPP